MMFYQENDQIVSFVFGCTQQGISATADHGQELNILLALHEKRENPSSMPY